MGSIWIPATPLPRATFPVSVMSVPSIWNPAPAFPLATFPRKRKFVGTASAPRRSDPNPSAKPAETTLPSTTLPGPGPITSSSAI